MSNQNLNRIFNHTECISTEKMIAYQEGILPEKEKNSIEIHLSSCSMCHDEFDGIMLLSDKSSLHATIFELNDKVDEILAKSRKKIPFLMPINLMAAIILFLIGFSWYAAYFIRSNYLQNKDLISQSLNEKPPSSNEEILILRPQSALSESERNREIVKSFNNSTISENEKALNIQDSEEIELKVDSITESNDFVKNRNENLSGIALSEITENNISKDELEKKKSDEDLKIISTYDDNSIINSEKDIASVSIEKDKKNRAKKESNKSQNAGNSSTPIESDQYSAGIEAYKKGDYKASIAILKESLNNHLPKDEIYYHIALCYENIQSYNESLNYFDKVLIEKQSKLFEDALWHKSGILLLQKKNEQALKSLQLIKNLKGTHSPKAQLIIDSLKTK